MRIVNTVVIFIAITAGSSYASVIVGSKVVGRPGVYDYSPSVTQVGNVQKFWWCGQASNPSNPSQNTDTIQYESVDLNTNAVTGPKTVLAESEGAWDSAYTCNPKVVNGSFVNPLGDGKTYTYAMYYVGTNLVSGALNSIGVAFSSDGVTWNKYPKPVITYTADDAASNAYGVGQPAAYNSDGKSGIWLFYEGSGGHYQTTSTDGVNFTNTEELTTTGLDQVLVANATSNHSPTWGDMAYDYTAGYWYAAFNVNDRSPSTTGGVTERGQPGILIYRIKASGLLNGSAPWEMISSVDTNLTGLEGNFIGSFLRDSFGNVNIGPYPQIELYTSSSLPAPAWNASPEVRGNSNDPSNWDISWVSWVPNDPLVALNRYFGSTHEVTTGYVDLSEFHLESTLAYLYESPQAGASVPIYACLQGSDDYFASLSSNCEGQIYLGINGYAYQSADAASGLVPLYRCYTGKDHFVSTDSACEGQAVESLLGYAKSSK